MSNWYYYNLNTNNGVKSWGSLFETPSRVVRVIQVVVFADPDIGCEVLMEVDSSGKKIVEINRVSIPIGRSYRGIIENL